MEKRSKPSTKTWVILVIVIVALLLSAYSWWTFPAYFYAAMHPGTNPIANPTLQGQIPTVQATPVDIVDWSKTPKSAWLTQEEARSLRGQQNVVNFALLQGGSAKYSATFSMSSATEYGWVLSPNDPSIKTATLENGGSGVDFTTTVSEYHLNLFQPFEEIDDTTETTPLLYMFVVDDKGILRLMTSKWLVRVPLSQVQQSLPRTLAPNPHLSFTISE